MQVAVRTVAIGLAVLAVTLLSIAGLLALARGPGTTSTTGTIVSIEDVPTGKVVCIRGESAEQIACGEVVQAQTPERLAGLDVGACAYIEVSRGAALQLEERSCD